MELLDKRYEDFRLFKLEREKVTTIEFPVCLETFLKWN